MSTTTRRTAGPTVAGTLALLTLAGCGNAATRAAVAPTLGEHSTAAVRAPAPPVPTPSPVRPSLLVNRPKPFTEDEVHRVRRLGGVTRIALIGYGQVYVYGQPIPTATVNPATYRSFTPPDTSGSAAVWAAVMDGKALVSHTVGERDHLPLDAVVPAGWSMVRIAGLATTVPGVDMVVSAATGEHIGVPFGNGLVVAVARDPERVAAKVRTVLPAATVQQIAGSGTVGMRSAPLLPTIVPVVPATPSGRPGGATQPDPAASRARRPATEPSAAPVPSARHR